MADQLSLFDTNTPCDGCFFKNIQCTHPFNYDCTDGAYRVDISNTICPNCGRKMGVVISAVDSDWARCNCGTNVIFRNQGRRKGWLEAWRDGEVIGK